MVNSRDPEACSAHWLDQPVEPYRVDVWLSEGDQIDAGGGSRSLHTLGTPWATSPCGSPRSGTDPGRRRPRRRRGLDQPYREGGRDGRAMESVERLAGLKARWACSGHGPAIVEPERALDAARERYEGWLESPSRPPGTPASGSQPTL